MKKKEKQITLGLLWAGLLDPNSFRPSPIMFSKFHWSLPSLSPELAGDKSEFISIAVW